MNLINDERKKLLAKAGFWTLCVSIAATHLFQAIQEIMDKAAEFGQKSTSKAQRGTDKGASALSLVANETPQGGDDA